MGGWVSGGRQGGSIGFEFARRMREKVRGEYRFSSLMKQKQKAKICCVIYIAGEKKLLILFYFVIVKQKFINGPDTTTGVGSMSKTPVDIR